ncbi:MAG: hypothetical protein KF716_31630, partial [Anaerolineae bacterium]|nr:hypothetical protein [Anaerolineae bacterium]
QLNGQQVALACTVETYSISAHADEAQLVNVVDALKPAQIALVHGDNAARHSIAVKLRERNHRVHLPVSGQAWLAMPAKASSNGNGNGSIISPHIEVYAAGAPLEQNEARRICLESFPPDARLRKISFETKRKRMLLTFDFPDRARDVYAHEIAVLAERCGWNIEVHPVAIQQALESAVSALLPDGVRLLKAPSVFAQRHEVEVFISETPEKDKLALAFFDLTGYRLAIRTSGRNGADTLTFAGASSAHPPIEINHAYRMIREVLEPYGLQKVGLRHGQLVLTFISPEVGLRQYQLMEQLARDTGYDLTLHPHPDQRAILHIVNHELRAAGWLVRKGPGLHKDHHEIVVHLYNAPAEDDRSRIATTIESQTGYQLQLKWDTAL